MSHLDEPIWDGNGGTLDPRKTTQRDLLVALHVKMDNVVIPALRDHEDRVRVLEALKYRLLGAAALAAVMAGLVGALIEAHHIV